MNILIVCGGTGGHLFPGIAVGEVLLERKHQVLLVVSKKEIDQKALQGTRGFLMQTLPAVGWRGLRPDRAFHFGVMMIKALFGAKQIFRDFQPDAVLGMGGFSSVAPLMVARLQGIPSCIHESNSIPGKANRLASRFATATAIGLETTTPPFPKDSTFWTGTPVRTSLRTRKDRTEILKKLNLSPDKPIVLVMGGSQGAQGLNKMVLDSLPHLSTDVQWIHLSGTHEEAKTRESYSQAGKTARVHGFCHEMENLYSIADLAIARSGAASLAEIAQYNLPSILIPYPFAAEQHQLANARIFVNAGAAILCEESKCSPQELASQIKDLLTQKDRLQKMSAATKSLHHGDAHIKLADLVEKLGKKK